MKKGLFTTLKNGQGERRDIRLNSDEARRKKKRYGGHHKNSIRPNSDELNTRTDVEIASKIGIGKNQHFPTHKKKRK